ncbi:hypothetical protein [Comamonas testosteroni]|uniref:hypothetical protein n=1 Tax=Comamonas testosteroni TaxID=285 RepID=UPI002E0D8A4B|nr:hypothetical protein U0024_14965 [Comamonas testosteroni]
MITLDNLDMSIPLFRPNTFALCALTIALGTIVPSWNGFAATEIGGKGSLKLPGLQEVCLQGTKAVPEVCGKIQVNWKLWTLMGEPIGDFVLGWKPTTVRIADADGLGSQNYLVDNLPIMLGNASQRMEMYVDAVAFVELTPKSVKHTTVAISFNTGVASKPGEMSTNVPGGYDWDNFLHSDMSTAGVATGLKGWCVEKGRGNLSAKDAKAVMIAGVKLENLTLCPKSSIDVSPIERAIDKTCESAFTGTTLASLPHFCSKKETKKPEAKKPNVIDDAFARLEGRKPAESAKPRSTDSMASQFESAETERQRREMVRVKALADQRAREVEAERQAARFNAVQSACKAVKEAQDNCAAKTCGRKPEATVCTRSEQEPTPPCMGGPGVSCIVIPKYNCVAHGPNPKRSEWEICSASAERSCSTGGMPISSVDECVEERMK